MFIPVPGGSDDSSDSQEGGRDDEVYVNTLESLLKGKKPPEVCQSLVDAGYTKEHAETIVQTALQFKQDQEAKEAADPQDGHAVRLMLAGAVVCVLGIFVGGLLAVVFPVAITGALVLFFWGLFQFGRGAWKWCRL